MGFIALRHLRRGMVLETGEAVLHSYTSTAPIKSFTVVLSNGQVFSQEEGEDTLCLDIAVKDPYHCEPSYGVRAICNSRPVQPIRTPHLVPNHIERTI